MRIKLEEVEWFSAVSTVLGVLLFAFACSWDNLVGVTVNHSQGYGWMQILVMAGSGLYSMWAIAISSKWRDYIKKIHKLGV